jgi:hypothetical protein
LLFLIKIPGARQVDVGRASDKAFFQDLETLVDQRIEEPGDEI